MLRSGWEVFPLGWDGGNEPVPASRRGYSAFASKVNTPVPNLMYYCLITATVRNIESC